MIQSSDQSDQAPLLRGEEEEEDERDHQPKPSCGHHIADFANIVKAFIGVNYLSMPFYFKQSGLGFGIVGLLLIALITDHCCHLIVKCKRYIIHKVCQEMKLLGSGTDRDVRQLESQLGRHMEYGDIGQYALGKAGIIIVNSCLVITQLGFCISYFVMIGNTAYKMFPVHHVIDNRTAGNGTYQYPLVEGDEVTVTVSPYSNLTNGSTVTTHTVSTSPPLELLVLIPLPLFIVFAYIRNIRAMGGISILANCALFIGFFTMVAYMIQGLSHHDDFSWSWYKLATLPVFFGGVTGAFEGIGTIIPIESSMESNKHNYFACLHGGIFLIATVLCLFGTLGYINFGDGTKQIILANISDKGFLKFAVDITLCIGVACTFPLQIFPVIQIFEGLLFSNTYYEVATDPVGDWLTIDCNSCCNEQRSDFEEEKPILPTTEAEPSPPTATLGISDSVPLWKRYLFRTFIVLIVAGIAVALRNVFAYIGAFTGAIGSSMLAFILPSLFHIKLKGKELPKIIIFKDVLIIVFGFLGGAISVFVTIQEVVKKA